MKALFGDTLKGQVDRFVSVDGTGLGITHIAVGSLRYRVTFSGPGGHSYGAFGIANPIHALGRAIAGFADMRPPVDPENDVQRGARGGRHVGERNCGGGLDGSRHAVGRPGGAARARLAISPCCGCRRSPRKTRAGTRRAGSRVEKALVGNAASRQRSRRSAPIVQAALSVTRALGSRRSSPRVRRMRTSR